MGNSRSIRFESIVGGIPVSWIAWG